MSGLEQLSISDIDIRSSLGFTEHNFSIFSRSLNLTLEQLCQPLAWGKCLKIFLSVLNQFTFFLVWQMSTFYIVKVLQKL